MPSAYRPDIDGLRGIAILLVLGYHTMPGLLKNGFIGVDIFFVISGYLITLLIKREVDAGTFRFKAFYASRVRRIFPALIITLVGVFVVAWWHLLPWELEQLGAYIFSGAGFFTNWYSLTERGYFDAQAQFKPLIHLWSLGIEEQFYIMWPVFLFVVLKTRRTIAAIAALACVSLLLNITLTYYDNIAAFMLPFTRLWEFAAGALIALMSLHNKSKFRQAAPWLFALGLFCILAALTLLPRAEMSYPGWRALLPVTGAALIIATSPCFEPRYAFLKWRPLIFTGLISYPLYMFHWPVLFFIHRYDFASINLFILTIFIAVVALFAVSWAVTRYIEKPIRFGALRPIALPYLCAALAACFILGVVTHYNGGFAARFPSVFSNIKNNEDAAWRADTCFLQTYNRPPPFADACAETKKPMVFLWGDSYAASIYPGLRERQKQEGFALSQYNAAQCAPLLNWKNPAREYCDEIVPQILDHARRLKPDIVLLFANWDFVVAEAKNDARGLVQTVAALREGGVRQIVLIGPLPHWERDLPQLGWRNFNALTQSGVYPSRLKTNLFSATPQVDAYMAQIAAELGITYFSPLQHMCNDAGCIAMTDANNFTTFDFAHLTLESSSQLAKSIPLNLPR